MFSPLAGAIVLGIGLLALLANASLSTAVLFLIVFIPFDAQRNVGPFWIYLDLALAAVAVPLLRHGRPRKHMWLLVPYVVFITAIGAGRAINPVWFWGYCVRWAVGLVFAAGVAASGASEIALLALGSTLVPLCFYGLYQLALGELGSLYYWMNPHMTDQPWTGRAYSFFFHPNAYGGFCAVITAMLVALALRGFHKRACMMLSVFGVIGILTSGSRGAFVGAALGLLVLLASIKGFGRKAAVAIPIVLGLWLASSVDWLPLEKRAQADEFTIDTRMTLFGAAAVSFASHPMIGIGTTNFAEQLPTIINWNYTIAHAHDVYLQVLAEEGIVGFILLFGPLLFLFRCAWQHRHDRMTLSCLVGLIVFCVHGFVDVLWAYNPQYLLLFLTIVGLLTGRVTVEMQVSNKQTEQVA